MTTTIHDDTTNTTLFLNGTKQSWVFAKDASIEITTTDRIGIMSYEGEGNTITINGMVSLAYGTIADALHVTTANTSLAIGATAFLSGNNAIYGVGDNLVVTNAGTLIGKGQYGSGVRIDGANGETGVSEVHNSGYIYGNLGVSLGVLKGLVVNEVGGEIVGQQYGIYVGNGNDTSGTVINHGTIRVTGYNSNYAVYMTTGADKLVNDGAIYGYVVLGAGNDVFDNRGGFVDGAIWGGDGDDTLIVDDAKYTLLEYDDNGLDTVRSAVSYTLSDNVENLTLLGGADTEGTGNALTNTITGNKGNNILDGGFGADTLVGGAGNDTYIVNSTDDAVLEASGKGVDTVRAAVSYALGADLESLLLTGTDIISGNGNSLANTITGNAAVNTLSGGAGDDIILGGAGVDTLDGGKGADDFVFKAGQTGATKATADTITDFAAADDIDLSAIDANAAAKGNQAFKFAGTTFTGHAGEVRFEKLASDTWIFADTNGDKKADIILHLDDAVTMKADYFVL